MKPGKVGIKRIIDASFYSLDGLKSAWQSEAAFRQEIFMAIPLIILSFFLPITSIEQSILIFSLFIVLIAELLNSAIEAVVDRTGSQWHELSKKAKDIGSAAVFVALILCFLVWLIILFPYIGK